MKYGDKGEEQNVNTLDKPITYDNVKEVRDAIKVGKMYSVTLTPAKSGKIATIVITDASNI